MDLFSKGRVAAGVTTLATKENFRDFRLRVLLAIFMLGPGFAIGPALPFLFPDLSQSVSGAFWVYVIVYLLQVASGINLLRTGGVGWFVVFISTVMGNMGISGASVFLIFVAGNSTTVTLFTWLTWFILFLLLWWCGSRVYCIANGEIKESVLLSKRIDLEAHTYAPYHFPNDLFKSKWLRNIVGLSTALGGAAIGGNIYLSHLIHSRYENGESMVAAVAGYLLVMIAVLVISAIFYEWQWIRRWEKKTGRKIYAKEIIEYKRLQENKRAEQANIKKVPLPKERGQSPMRGQVE